jgi:hypothetical protein
MPIRRAAELSVKTLVANALGVLFGFWCVPGLSSNLYDFGKTGAPVVLNWTQLGPRSVVSSADPAYKMALPYSAVSSGIERRT